MRFIHKNGRVIPIREAGEESYRKAQVSAAKTGAVAGVLAHGARVAALGKARKAAIGLAVAGSAVAIGGDIRNAVRANRIAKESKGRIGGLHAYFGQSIPASLSSIAAQRVGAIGMGTQIKTVIKATKMATAATAKGFGAAHKASETVREARKFKKAKRVYASASGLLTK